VTQPRYRFEAGGSARIVLVLLLVAAAAIVVAMRARAPVAAADARLSWIASAQQLGTVGYRDPAGAISPDGRWIAYSESRFLGVQPIAGGAPVQLTTDRSNKTQPAWSPDGRYVALTVWNYDATFWRYR
jgi:WD40 repeat protein